MLQPPDPPEPAPADENTGPDSLRHARNPARERRQAAALRDNLRRRKQQTRARQQATTADPDPAPPSPAGSDPP